MALSVLMEIEQRRNLYWNKYKYCLHFIQSKVTCLRTSGNLDQSIEQHKFWERQRWGHKSYIQGSFVSEFNDKVVADLRATADFLEKYKDKVKIVYSTWNHAYLYTNDKSLITALEKLPHIDVCKKKQAEVSMPQGIIMLNDPKYQFRTYFKSRNITDDTSKRLKDWLASQGDEVQLAPSLDYWVKYGTSRYYSNWTQDYWHINHNNKSYESMLSLVAPGLVRKTMILQRR